MIVRRAQQISTLANSLVRSYELCTGCHSGCFLTRGVMGDEMCKIFFDEYEKAVLASGIPKFRRRGKIDSKKRGRGGGGGYFCKLQASHPA